MDARGQLRIAHEMLTTMGAAAFAERARRELFATGGTVRKRTDEARDDLTPQEAEITRLAGEGRTNPEIGAELFISPRTVEWHLRKVFSKLGLASRKELREAVPRSGAWASPPGDTRSPQPADWPRPTGSSRSYMFDGSTLSSAGRGPVRLLEHEGDVVCVAVRPVFTGLKRRDDRMRALAHMRRGVPVGR